MTTTTNNSICTPLVKQQRVSAIERKQLDLFVVHVVRAEIRFHQAEKAFNTEYTRMQDNHRNLVRNKGMTTALSNVLEQRLTNITDRLRDLYNYRVNFYLRSSYGDRENSYKKANNVQREEDFHRRTFLVNLLSDTTTQALTAKQIQLLSRGPTYVPPCQLHIAASSKSTDDVAKHHYAPLKRQLASVFSKHRINIALSWDMQNNVNQKFVELFSHTLPANIQQRALDELKLVQSIRHALKRHHLILRRTADNQNIFYLGNRDHFESKANDYVSKSDTHELIKTSNNDDNDHSDEDERQQQSPQQILKARVASINCALDILKRRKALDTDTIQKLVLDASKVKLPRLYFLPDVLNVRHVFCLLFLFTFD